jgi:hypothetical protein
MIRLAARPAFDEHQQWLFEQGLRMATFQPEID